MQNKIVKTTHVFNLESMDCSSNPETKKIKKQHFKGLSF